MDPRRRSNRSFEISAERETGAEAAPEETVGYDLHHPHHWCAVSYVQVISGITQPESPQAL